MITLFICLILSGFLSAETTQPSPESTQNPPSDSTDYVLPQPQKTRIEALITSITRRRLDHQIQNLEANGEAFLTLYRPALTHSTEGCLILLHSDNEHPDWPDAIAPLRNAMPAHSWCTFSIEVPDVTLRAAPIKTITSEENNDQANQEQPNQAVVFARIQATIDQANTQNIGQIALLGYGTGASYALSFLATNPTSVNALILIEIKASSAQQEYPTAQSLSLINQPTLDYYTQTDSSEQFSVWRQQAANQQKNSQNNYTALNALFDHQVGEENGAVLIQRVRGFLKQNTTQKEQRSALPTLKKGLFYESP
ncbi:DUF3530 family protein [Marinomonas sp. IMCC 4694]|uniref:DUF3530 family protein n=1 Tax=Marinomonas sp. IMCC 4694 TaxID=2605432 RepID=UPI003975C3BE